jgi:hypothetical protein
LITRMSSLPQRCEIGGGEPGDAVRFGKVDGRDGGCAASLEDALLDPLERLGVSRPVSTTCAPALASAIGGGSADAATCARDQGDLSGERLVRHATLLVCPSEKGRVSTSLPSRSA